MTSKFFLFFLNVKIIFFLHLLWIVVENSVDCRGNCGKITLQSLWKTYVIVDKLILISYLLILKSA